MLFSLYLGFIANIFFQSTAALGAAGLILLIAWIKYRKDFSDLDYYE